MGLYLYFCGFRFDYWWRGGGQGVIGLFCCAFGNGLGSCECFQRNSGRGCI